MVFKKFREQRRKDVAKRKAFNDEVKNAREKARKEQAVRLVREKERLRVERKLQAFKRPGLFRGSAITSNGSSKKSKRAKSKSQKKSRSQRRRSAKKVIKQLSPGKIGFLGI